MNNNYLNLIEEAYQGEVYGEAMYQTIADNMDNPDYAYKWRVLAQMEAETKVEMRDLVARWGGEIAESEAWRDRGRQDARRYAALSWLELMEIFTQELEADIAEYTKLEEDCPPEDAATLRRLTEHEILTKQFCDQELNGQGDVSILPIITFCKSPPGRA